TGTAPAAAFPFNSPSLGPRASQGQGLGEAGSRDASRGCAEPQLPSRVDYPQATKQVLRKSPPCGSQGCRAALAAVSEGPLEVTRQ
ncbi:hypothetical protein E2I00_011613, partial [Balaenoptera physalus]